MYILCSVCILFVGSFEAMSASEEKITLYDFQENDIVKKKNIEYGTWETHPSYIADANVITPKNENEARKRGKVLQVDYDLSYPEEDIPSTGYPVFNGVWFKLDKIDLRDVDKMSIGIKGDKKRDYTHVCKFEIKNNVGEKASLYIDGIQGRWRRFYIPLKMFRDGEDKPMKDLSSLTELILVFEKNKVTSSEGTIYIDDIEFIKKDKAKQ